jgi:hypothetical protein
MTLRSATWGYILRPFQGQIPLSHLLPSGLRPGATFCDPFRVIDTELQRRARIRITADARLVIHPGAVVTGEERMLDKLRRRGRVVERLDQ